MGNAASRETDGVAHATLTPPLPHLNGDIEVVPIAEAALRRRVGITGLVREQRQRTVGSGPILECRLEDPTGSVILRFLGRAAVPGVEVGRRLVIEGTIGYGWGGPVVWNPIVRSSW